MACYFTLFSTFILSILLIIPLAESSRCSKKYTFPPLPLNSSIPSNFSQSSNDPNDNINQECEVNLAIDFTTGFVNVSFDPKNQSVLYTNQLRIRTIFSLNDTSIKVNITYTCSMSDYCDLDFVRETLSPKLAAMPMESLRQNLTDRLYNPNNTDPIQCSNNNLCPQNSTFCVAMYIYENKTDGEEEEVGSECISETDVPLRVFWEQHYSSYSIAYHSSNRLTNTGDFFCNIPNCGSNATIIETFQWLTRDYILPVNISVLNVKITTSQPTTTTSTQGSTTTTNYASILFGHFNIIIQCFIIILFLY